MSYTTKEGMDYADKSPLKTFNFVEIPDNATNGDVIKAIFPKAEFYDMAFTVHATTKVTSNGVKGGISYDFWKDWWNAPYKREGGGE